MSNTRENASAFPVVDPGQLTVKKSLGQGSFGMTLYCEYTGDDPALKAVCDSQGCLVLKLPVARNTNSTLVDGVKQPGATGEVIKRYLEAYQQSNPGVQPLSHEADMITYLTDEAKEDCKYNKGRGISVAGMTLVAMSFEAYGYDEDNKPYAVGDMNSFVGEMNAAAYLGSSHEAKVWNNRAAACVQIVNAEYESVSAMHDVGVVHFDGAGRNKMPRPPQCDEEGNHEKYRVTTIDYGLSERFDPETGVVHARHERTIPPEMRCRDLRDKNEFSVRADLYASKIDAVNRFLAIMAPNRGSQVPPMFADIILHVGNQERYQYENLQRRFDLVFMSGEQLFQTRDPKTYEGFQLFRMCYRDYLTKVPEGTSVAEYRAADRQVLVKANDTFVNLNVQRLVDNFLKGELSKDDFLLEVRMYRHTEPTSSNVLALKQECDAILQKAKELELEGLQQYVQGRVDNGYLNRLSRQDLNQILAQDQVAARKERQQQARLVAFQKEYVKLIDNQSESEKQNTGVPVDRRDFFQKLNLLLIRNPDLAGVEIYDAAQDLNKRASSPIWLNAAFHDALKLRDKIPSGVRGKALDELHEQRMLEQRRNDEVEFQRSLARDRAPKDEKAFQKSLFKLILRYKEENAKSLGKSDVAAVNFATRLKDLMSKHRGENEFWSSEFIALRKMCQDALDDKNAEHQVRFDPLLKESYNFDRAIQREAIMDRQEEIRVHEQAKAEAAKLAEEAAERQREEAAARQQEVEDAKREAERQARSLKGRVSSVSMFARKQKQEVAQKEGPQFDLYKPQTLLEQFRESLPEGKWKSRVNDIDRGSKLKKDNSPKARAFDNLARYLKTVSNDHQPDAGWDWVAPLGQQELEKIKKLAADLDKESRRASGKFGKKTGKSEIGDIAKALCEQAAKTPVQGACYYPDDDPYRRGGP